MSGRNGIVAGAVLALLGLVAQGFGGQSQVTSEPNVPTLYVVGDSTASNGQDLGWGSHLGGYFDSTKIAVVNRARGGRSSRTFQAEGLWDQVVGQLKSGDFVLIQFGHNDGGPVNDSSRARGSLPGLGEETQEIHNQLANRDEVVHTFGWYMRKYVADTRAKGATPIVLSLTVRNIWKDGKVERGSGRFSGWAAQVAKDGNVAFVDLTNIIADQYDLLGAERVASLFPKDHTHTNAEGANLNAALVVSGLKALEGCPLAGMLSPLGQAVTPPAQDVFMKQTEAILTRPWMPEAQPPVDNNLPTLFLIGDSTVRTGSLGNGANGQWGWGAPIADFFDRTRINVRNLAWGGTSSRTFITQGFWDKVLVDLKPGDYVIMQFGHNDAGPVNDSSRARGTIRGVGEESQEIDNQLSGKHEVVHTYGWYLRKLIADTRAKGATPIVCSPIPRNGWEGDRVARASQSYGLWAAETAEAEGVLFIDLNELIARRYEQMGRPRVTSLCFPPAEHTHTSAFGARINAACVVEGLRSHADCPLLGYLRKDAP
ncbi:MAG: rhamnogalacturonan acetylesterase [Planctomycetes bacterium]|nr:rhamnogalacturonan acetylesterase [Planctomycetota bacterium]